MRRALLWLLLAFCLAGTLTACGKKGELEPPRDIEGTYPRQYPR